MSILIKGMKMPENCIKCPMQFGGMCYVMPADVDESRVAPTVEKALKQGKPDWCPLVEVPVHGRLIDADALIKKCGDWYVEEGTESGFIGTLKNLLATEPTIQPEKAQLYCEGTTKGTTSDTISRQAAIDAIEKNACNTQRIMDAVNNLPSAQPELIEKTAYIRGFEQGRTQGMIDSQGGKK